MKTDIYTDLLANESIWAELRKRFDLTQRQWELVRGLCEGRTIKEIARIWTRSPKTPQAIKASVMRKLGVDSTEAIFRLFYAAIMETAIGRGIIGQMVLPCRACGLHIWASQSPLLRQADRQPKHQPEMEG